MDLDCSLSQLQFLVVLATSLHLFSILYNIQLPLNTLFKQSTMLWLRPFFHILYHNASQSAKSTAFSRSIKLLTYASPLSLQTFIHRCFNYLCRHHHYHHFLYWKNLLFKYRFGLSKIYRQNVEVSNHNHASNGWLTSNISYTINLYIFNLSLYCISHA